MFNFYPRWILLHCFVWLRDNLTGPFKILNEPLLMAVTRVGFSRPALLRFECLPHLILQNQKTYVPFLFVIKLKVKRLYL
ncbi:hypothetical protein C4553_02390 [Candidatus Parcubacteria bacterium]|nr:MAG: hypothetical protein C4553_02390 [Candidatus Parcubacteria bacterium]